ncbi:hypothetical protein J1N35_032437 [Gossypium stocksii]|uniref:Uncharacterized protein n=1 Tax=Gossypium stocksii TaxID=47602 RepID=A0A9D3ZW92_9ROSI|nr:hypothetical protein J1N35_032437 [Gossypium stocksii]
MAIKGKTIMACLPFENQIKTSPTPFLSSAEGKRKENPKGFHPFLSARVWCSHPRRLLTCAQRWWPESKNVIEHDSDDVGDQRLRRRDAQRAEAGVRL